MTPYACPSCKNRSRFYLLEQHPVAVKIHPQTGAIMEELGENDPFMVPYRGESMRLQCGVCGITENERAFAKMAERV